MIKDIYCINIYTIYIFNFLWFNYKAHFGGLTTVRTVRQEEILSFPKKG